MLKSIDDLALDNPDVVAMLSNFIARAMVDDVLPPGFFDFVPRRLLATNPLARQVAGSVHALMDKHSSTRLINIWGAGAKSSVEELKASVKTIVDEYFVQGELDEALDCVRELDAAHFGHEVVKRIVYQAVERGDKDLRRGMQLLKGLLETSILDQHQLTLGMQRCVEGLADLSIDVPHAPERLRTLADWLAFEHLVSPAFEHAVMLKAKERAALSEVPSERVKTFATIIVEEFLVSSALPRPLSPFFSASLPPSLVLCPLSSLPQCLRQDLDVSPQKSPSCVCVCVCVCLCMSEEGGVLGVCWRKAEG